MVDPFQIIEKSDLILAYKPPGILTHADGTGASGFVELLSAQVGTKLLVCHRLDRETSGAMIFARTKSAAAQLTRLFEAHEVKKKYVFCSKFDRPHDDFEVRSEIKKIRGRLVSHLRGAINAHTSFSYKSMNKKGFHVWFAVPHTGKTHQIRLHAKSAGIPIYGDSGNDGADRLYLHSLSISFLWNEEQIMHTAPLPSEFSI